MKGKHVEGGLPFGMMNELMDCSAEDLKAQFDQIMQPNRYLHDIAVLFGSLGVHPEKYSTFMNTLDDIERNTK